MVMPDRSLQPARVTDRTPQQSAKPRSTAKPLLAQRPGLGSCASSRTTKRTRTRQIRLIWAASLSRADRTSPAQNRRTLESGHTIPCGCEGSSSWTCSRAGSPGQREGQRRNDKGNRGSCRRRRCSRERVHDRATRPEKRHHGHAKTAPEYRRYTGDRRSLKPFGPYNARDTGDHCQFFRSDMRR